MSITKVQLGVGGVLAVAGATGFALQQQSQTQLRNEIAELQQQNQQIAALRTVNDRLSRAAAEVAALHGDDAEFARLSAEATALKSRVQAEAAAAAAEKTRKTIAELAAKNANAAKGSLNLDLAKLDRLPKANLRAAPVYPNELYTRGIEGEVVVNFIVGNDGLVHNAVAVRSSRPEFEAAAIDAVNQWKFDPGMKGGRSVNTRMEVPIAFKIDDKLGKAGGITVPEGETNWF